MPPHRWTSENRSCHGRPHTLSRRIARGTDTSRCMRTISVLRSPPATTTTAPPCSPPRRSPRPSIGSRRSQTAGPRSNWRSALGASGCRSRPPGWRAARGGPVTGMERSAAMVEQLRAKPGGAELPVTIGDMATTTVAGTFSLVYLVFNTIVNLTSQDAQVDCFVNAASHLLPGGCFVVEVNVPQLRRLPPGDRANVFATGPEHWGIDVLDVVEQRLVSHHFTATVNGVRHTSIPFRYVWPPELDLMARIAGLRLRHRWGDWRGSAFTADSRSHVSVWEKPDA